MKQYLNVVREVMHTGTRKENRTGVDTISTFNFNYETDLCNGFPLLTTKEISWKNIVVEMLWFLSGKTDIGLLKHHKCKFWDAWADASGKVPSAYGNFWRRFPIHSTRDTSDWRVDGDPCLGFNDQIAWVINELKTNPMSRRMVVSAWAPGNAQFSKLPPCHSIFMLNVQNKTVEAKAIGKFDFSDPQNPLIHGERTSEQRLCLHLTQRSCDVALGLPYNIASYALLIHLLGRFGSIEPGIFAHSIVDAHVYTSKPDGSMSEYDHIPGLMTQLTREPRPLPKLIINPSIRDLKDIESLMSLKLTTEEVMSNFIIEGYDPHPAIQFKVAV